MKIAINIFLCFRKIIFSKYYVGVMVVILKFIFFNPEKLIT
jgi:hypothetical protein